MTRLIVVLAIGAAVGALGATACGGGDKPPLTPDGAEQLPPEAAPEAGAPSTPSAPGTPTAPAK